jgi:GntR family transcriptional repressor for pyruvate dehydrogenase complex
VTKRVGLEIVTDMPRLAEGGKPLRRKASEEVAQRIVNDVVNDGLDVGARLPSEAEMITSYGVSRETLREALRLLEVQGMISIRRGPGGGPTVEAVNAGFLARTASLYFHLAGASYDEVFAAWQQVEPPLAARAAANPDRARVKELLTPFLSEDVTTDPAFATKSMHEVVISLSGNRVMRLMASLVGHIVSDQVMQSLPYSKAGDLVAHDHAEIAEAIIKGHKRRAQDLMDAHITKLYDYYRTTFPERMYDPILWR